MKVRLPGILSPGEWAIVAGGLLCAGLIYALLVAPSLKLVTGLEEARAAKTAADQTLDQAHVKHQRLQKDIADAQARLAELGGAPPNAGERDLQLSRLTSLAQRCGVTIDQYSPLDTVDDGDYCAFYVQFTGRGHFQSIRDYFDGVESEIDFVDLTHFTISSMAADPSGLCSFAWSCQINGMPTDEPEAPRAAQRPSGRAEMMEVARHDPP